MENQLYWYNYAKHKYECISTPADFKNYIPQTPAAQNLYVLYTKHKGIKPLDAAYLILVAAVEGPEKAREE